MTTDQAHKFIMGFLDKYTEAREAFLSAEQTQVHDFIGRAEATRFWLAMYDAECALVTAHETLQILANNEED